MILLDLDTDKRFYVYEWFIIDTLEVFYVGKGTGRRRFELHNRSKYFKNIYNKYQCDVRLYKVNLTNEESCFWEIERIYELKNKNQARCNFTNGGTGFSTGKLNPTYKNPHFGNKNGMIIHKIDFKGEKNPFYNKTHTEETKLKISRNRKGKGARYGKENPMYGNHRFAGENNPMYGVKGINHPNASIYKVVYLNEEEDILTYKQCEKKFGIAFSRVSSNGGILHYKGKSKNSIYEGVLIIKLN